MIINVNDSILFTFSDIIRHLKHYGLNTLPHVSINRALNEARQILATIKGRNYADDDITARTGMLVTNINLTDIYLSKFDCEILSHLIAIL